MIASTFDATFRVVAANLGISVVPAEVGRTCVRIFDMKIVPLTDAWAKRRFAVRFRTTRRCSRPRSGSSIM